MEEIHNSRGKVASGLSASLSLVVSTSITHCAAMGGGRGGGDGEWSLTRRNLVQWIRSFFL